ncbi:uncharacterized protein At2g39920 [Momordica charantia]|uniref:Uncharacterized protein At2g39920 n=1 Tax=Momordica charantia TaxID=3673 RepID=A0A6J1DWF6_MOMCH|nr:uncharacterized protein At2g39920 [Momordica charantia]XP_022156925.1 uncharacterized protein At2g39920 [Momordica charantia]XP_022156926.1 uncharacterized protein At2g39920 [Momordica charantia]
MSAYGSEMERRFSIQSHSSGGSSGSSDMGSRYIVESGFYMTPLTATIFIGALVTVGVLLITLLVSLTVMLQYCQNKSEGVVEIQKPGVGYDYCKALSVHLELNSLETDGIPSFCKNFAIQYIKTGQYERDLDSTLQVVDNYFCGAVQVNNGRDIVLMDIDDVLFENPGYDNLLIPCCVDEAKILKQKFLLQLYKKLRSCGWPLILISRKSEVHRNATIERLTSAGCKGWLLLIMRMDDEVQIDHHEYFTKQQAALLYEGFRIVGVMSSHMDALSGPPIGTRIYKLPNPIHFNINYQNMRKQTQI